MELEKKDHDGDEVSLSFQELRQVKFVDLVYLRDTHFSVDFITIPA
jgi:hypothetical protein